MSNNELEQYNRDANDKWNEEALIKCGNCNRTFLPERMAGHQKICSPEKPFKPLPSSGEEKIKTGGHERTGSMPGNQKWDDVKIGGGSKTMKMKDDDDLETYTSPTMAKKKVGYDNEVSKSTTFKKPKTVMCYICGKEFGTTSIGIHIKQCEKKWVEVESKKPYSQRRPVPSAPNGWDMMVHKLEAGEKVDMDELDNFNSKSNDKWNDEALIRCEHCNRTFLPERMPAHKKVCSKENPFKPLPGAGGKSNVTQSQSISSTSTKASKYDFDEDDEGAYEVKQTTYNSKSSTTTTNKSNPSSTMGGGTKSTTTVKKTSMMEFANLDLVPCSICGRKFNSDRIDKHQSACQKAKKGEAKHAKKVALAEKKLAEVEKFVEKEKKYKTSKWKSQHMQFQQALQSIKGDSGGYDKFEVVGSSGGGGNKYGGGSLSSYQDPGLCECPYCGRKFADNRIEKHEEICKNVMNKPKAPPKSGSYMSGPGPSSGYTTVTKDFSKTSSTQIQKTPQTTSKTTTTTTKTTSQNIFSTDSKIGGGKPSSNSLSVQGNSAKITSNKKTSYY